MKRPPVWAVCCSGGGIRSASYCLGALQWLEGVKFLANVKLIVGVSGGSYIAASRALVARGLERDAGHGDTSGQPPYAPGTAEEQHLRDNTRYLAPDAKTLLAGVYSLLFGVAVTLVLVLAPVFAAAHAWGWLLRSQKVLIHARQWTVTLTGTTWWIWSAIAAAVMFALFLWWWVTLMPGWRGDERHSQVAVSALGWAAFLTLLLALAMFAVPAAIAWLSGPHAGAFGLVLDDLGFGAGATWTPAALVGLGTAIVAVSHSAGRLHIKLPATAMTRYLRGLLLPWLASVLVLLAFAVVGLRWVREGAAAGFTAGQIWLVIGALAVMLIMRLAADANRISMHDFYRWRLSTAFAVTRTPFGVKDFSSAILSCLSGQQPELVLCTTANINAQRDVPAGRGGLSFAFDPDYATLHGLGSSESVRVRTADYEALAGRRRFTLFDVSAISGAAISPLMGTATRHAMRILFTATDLRLGIWLPHPAVVAAAGQELERQQKPGASQDRWWHAVRLLLWYALPHPLSGLRNEKLNRHEARVWAYVLKLRKDTAHHSRQFFGALLYHALQPTLGMLYAEAAGHTSYRSTWMCVTDGGHYDNLGLVEALRRAPELGITHVMVLDASGDKADTWFSLGESIALARCDADTEVVLNPATMITSATGEEPHLLPGQVVRPWVSGTFTSHGSPQENTILVCKLGWWVGAPPDVRAYAAGHPSYPADPTIEQLYDSTEFEAYRVLGAATVELALKEGRGD